MLPVIVLYKLWSIKRNIQHFSDELEKLKNSDYTQPVKVTDFDKAVVKLAVKLNEHTNIQRVLAVEQKRFTKNFLPYFYYKS